MRIHKRHTSAFWGRSVRAGEPVTVSLPTVNMVQERSLGLACKGYRARDGYGSMIE